MGTQPIETAADGLADTPLDTVAHHGLAERAGNRKTNVRSIRLRFAYTKRGEERSTEAATVVVHSSEIFGAQQADTFRKTCDEIYLSELTVSFLRPRARRRAKTARPFLVSMRERNPCVLAR
jgi:hypothetical protein